MHSKYNPVAIPSAHFGADDVSPDSLKRPAGQPDPKDQLAIDALVKDMQLNAARLAQIYRIEMMNPVVNYSRGYWNITFSAYKSRKAPEPLETYVPAQNPNVPAVQTKPDKVKKKKKKVKAAKAEPPTKQAPKQIGKPLRLAAKSILSKSNKKAISEVLRAKLGKKVK